MRSWLDDWESEATQAREAMAAAAADDYKFAESNPFLNVSSPSMLTSSHFNSVLATASSVGGVFVQVFVIYLLPFQQKM